MGEEYSDVVSNVPSGQAGSAIAGAVEYDDH